MGKVVLVLWILAILFGVFWYGYYQEGQNQDVTIEMEAKGVMAADGKVYLTSHIFARINEKNGKKDQAIIVDTKEQTLTIINYKRKTYATEPITFVSDLSCEKALIGTPLLNKTLKRLPDHKMIADYSCHAFEADVPEMGGKVTMWYAYDLPTGRVKTALWNKLARAEAKGLGAQALLVGIKGQVTDTPPICSCYEYFPAPLAVDMRNAHATATSVTFGKVDPSEFEVPSDFEKKTIEEVVAQQPTRRTR